MDIDSLEFGGEQTTQTTVDTTVDNKPVTQPDEEGEDINGGAKDKEELDNKGEEGNKEEGNKEDKQGDDDNSSTGELEVGTEIEFDGVTYTIDDNHNLVDKDGKVFKKADELDAWLKEQEVEEEEEEDNGVNLSAIQQEVGVEVTDESGNPVEFSNDAKGVAAYVNAVLDLQRGEIQEATINKFYQDNPLVKNFIDYVTVNGTYEGFGELKDRSNIVLDKDNDRQLEAVIRMAANEFGNSSLSDNYIKYLRDNGGLYDEAVIQLENLVNYDKQVRADIEQRATAARKQEQEELAEYWKKIDTIVKSRTIGGYKIPESFTKEVDGKKMMFSINDFYDYCSKPKFKDANGNLITAYQRDLNAMSDEDVMNNDLINAYLHFTGGSYKDLANMAINEAEVRRLRVKAKEHRAAKSVRISRPAKSNKADDIALA